MDRDRMKHVLTHTGKAPDGEYNPSSSSAMDAISNRQGYLSLHRTIAKIESDPRYYQKMHHPSVTRDRLRAKLRN